MFVLENDGLTRFSERPIVGAPTLMVKDEPFIIHKLEVGAPASFELMTSGGFLHTSKVVSIVDEFA